MKEWKVEKENEIKENKKRLERIKTIYNGSEEKNLSYSFEEFKRKYIYIILESDFIYNKPVYHNGIDVMSGLSKTDECKNLILEKWNRNEISICESFNLSGKEYFRLLQNKISTD
ncbi:hypothetical protein [Paenibacillus oryzisoli]|uniref:Uncharacterized protein n=1 Tax=Paenibacillus oryzisoli TaxID=1850517 RepID=A0A198A018_9BACL|nr:hypothetical protein [Paenibacillus oryzisoli]OAS14799.1 hypothetical protein A8708_04670 [Paenibacillus oryzisoli]